MPVNPNDVKYEKMEELLNKIESKINEVITEGEIAVDPLDLGDEE